LHPTVPPAWLSALQPYLPEAGSLLEQILDRIDEERTSGIQVYPSEQDLFKALHRTGPDEVRVLVLGQDPYHGPGQADGLAFSVPGHLPPPPSLRQIYKAVLYDRTESTAELHPDWLHSPIDWMPPATAPSEGPETSRLEHWARQGVLLINHTWSVRRAQPGSHARLGWMKWTHALLQAVQYRQQPMVWMLWGKEAQNLALRSLAENKANAPRLLLQAPHPSPLSAHRGFLTCRHFSQANQFLQSYL